MRHLRDGALAGLGVGVGQRIGYGESQLFSARCSIAVPLQPALFLEGGGPSSLSLPISGVLSHSGRAFLESLEEVFCGLYRTRFIAYVHLIRLGLVS